MPTEQEYNDYAVAVIEQFDAFVHWAIAQWPNHHSPLTADDFSAGRHELTGLLGARLNVANDGEKSSIGKKTMASSSVGPSDASEQYVNMNPAPWP